MPSSVSSRRKQAGANPVRRTWSVSIYCRHQGAVLVRHSSLGIWLPVGGEITANETPFEAAQRVLREETGFIHEVIFPAIHKVTGAPPGLLLYEEHEAGEKGVHLNFAFLTEVPSKRIAPNDEYLGVLWVRSVSEIPDACPVNVREALPYALTAGRERILPS